MGRHRSTTRSRGNWDETGVVVGLSRTKGGRRKNNRVPHSPSLLTSCRHGYLLPVHRILGYRNDNWNIED